jgi:hypothetical protein
MLRCNSRSAFSPGAGAKESDKWIPGRTAFTSCYDLLDVVWTMDKKGLIAVARYLIDRIPANFARFQMIENLKFFVQSQLLVQQHQQLFKTAFAHNSLSMVNRLTSKLNTRQDLLISRVSDAMHSLMFLFNRCRS